MTDEFEDTWHVRSGCGLLASAPLSEELRAAHAKEDEREAEQVRLEAERRASEQAERVGMQRLQGRVPRSPQELMAQMMAPEVAAREREALATERRQAKALAEAAAKPTPIPPHLKIDRWALKKKFAEQDASKAVTPATQSDLKEVDDRITGLSSSLGMLKKKLGL